MNYLFFYLNLIFLFINSDDKIYEGKLFPGYRIYVETIENESILVEIGGTTTKMGGDYQILCNRNIKINNIITVASSSDKKNYIFKKDNLLYFSYDGIKGKRCFKLNQVTYSNEIERIRKGIFSSFYYSK